jgi:transcriptional regulator with XRE-family HTH domain
VPPSQTALGQLLQARREALGYSRARVGELIGIKPGTIEGWELGRVTRPPIHDVLRLTRYLEIPATDIERAVFADAGDVPERAEVGHHEAAIAGRRRRPRGGVPLLEAAYRLFGWASDADAAEALGATADQVQSWRTGTAQMAFSEYMVLASMIGVAAAASMNGDNARIADISAAAAELGVDLTPRTPATATG